MVNKTDKLFPDIYNMENSIYKIMGLEKIKDIEFKQFDLQNPLQVNIEDKYRLFNTTLKSLCKNDHWKAIPTVCDILFSTTIQVSKLVNKDYVFSTRIFLLYLFLMIKGDKRSVKEIKLQEYINFIRLERNKIYNVNFKVKNRKFISGIGYGISGMGTGKPIKVSRSMTLDDYILILHVREGKTNEKS